MWEWVREEIGTSEWDYECGLKSEETILKISIKVHFWCRGII